MDKVCITLSENDVAVLPLELLCMPLVCVANIDEQPLLCLSNMTILCPKCFPSEIRPTKDCPDLALGFCFRYLVLRPGPPIINVVLEIPAVNELSISCLRVMHSSIL